MSPISSGATLAVSMALRAAFTAIVDVQSSASAMWREWIPVCEWIHSSEVSSDRARSSFVTTFGGR